MTLKEELDHGVLSRVAEDEPVFVLRAKDALAVGAIEVWISLAEEAAVSPSKIAEADELCGLMEEWQHRNGSKIPD